MGSGEFGLRAAHELPGNEVYEAELVAYRLEEGDLALDAVAPISCLQTPEEREAYAQAEAERAREASRHGVRFGSDRRDWGAKILNPPQETSDEANGPSLPLGMPPRSTAEDLAAAEAALQRHNQQVNARTRVFYH